MAKKVEVNALWEAVKFPLRLLVLAIIPFAMAYLSELSYEWAGVVVAILAFLDKLLHELWKEDKVSRNGLVPF